MKFILENKEWLFSGVGVTVVSCLLYTFCPVSKTILFRICCYLRGDKSELTLSKIETKKFEIESYWGYRPSAHTDMKKSLMECKSRIFVVGIGLNTIIDVLNDPNIISKIASRLKSEPGFTLKIVVESKGKNKFCKEPGRIDRGEKKKRGIDALSKFYGSLSKEVPENIVRPLINVKTYNDYVQPHHFILLVDEVIYIGSYLSHKEGQYSYLIKIRQKGDGLYKLLSEEIEYIDLYSENYQIDEIDEIDKQIKEST